jgi:ABC-type microcin C transport system permease subunit YejE
MNKDDAPPPAEAATEVGIDDDAVESLGRLVLLGLCVVVLVGLITLAVGVLV